MKKRKRFKWKVIFPFARGKSYRRKVYEFDPLSSNSTILLRTHNKGGHKCYNGAKFLN